MTGSGVRVRALVPSCDVDVDLSIGPGQTVAVMGPNGAGKSTLLAVMAGLVVSEVEAGAAVQLDGRSLDDVPLHRRGVAVLSQDPLLFPHLSALDNVAFVHRAHGLGRRAARIASLRQLDELGVGHLVSVKPGQLSGGQAQRVAIARALAARPALLLLDEPMASLDVDVAARLRHTLRTVLRDQTAVIVTHDTLDAILLADVVVVVEAGRITEHGTPHEVLTTPRSSFAAQLAGVNLVVGTWDGKTVRTVTGTTVTGRSSDDVTLGQRAVALFHPSAVGIYAHQPVGSLRNYFDVEIARLESIGDRVRVRAVPVGSEAGHCDLEQTLTAEVTATAATELALVPGRRVTFGVKATEVSVHDAGASLTNQSVPSTHGSRDRAGAAELGGPSLGESR